jgi:hypothetical protein
MIKSWNITINFTLLRNRRHNKYCYKEGMAFAIGADLDESVMRAIESFPEGEWRPYRRGHICEMAHCMNRTQKAFRLIATPAVSERVVWSGEQ